MNIYVWRDVGNVTRREHDGGGVVAMGLSLEDARRILGASGEVQPNCLAFKVDPDIVVEKVNSSTIPQAWAFQDAGCC